MEIVVRQEITHNPDKMNDLNRFYCFCMILIAQSIIEHLVFTVYMILL